LAVIITIDREVRIILELPGTKKEYIKINANENVIEIKTTVSIRKY
jgi:HSP20 family protein